MAEFTFMEQQMLTQDLSDQQKVLFNGQFLSERKDRTLIFVVSLIFGSLGVDRFLVGDIGWGVLKLLTFGGCGILWLIDLFLIWNRVDDFNRRKAHELLDTIRMTTRATPPLPPPAATTA
jgi:TM2 domain-containing membrane protein YozV